MDSIREQLLSIRPKAVSVLLPDCGITIFVRSMSALAQLELEELHRDKAKSKVIIGKSVSECLCDADGNTLFCVDDVDQLLSRLSSEDLGVLTIACLERNGITDEGRERLKKKS